MVNLCPAEYADILWSHVKELFFRLSIRNAQYPAPPSLIRRGSSLARQGWPLVLLSFVVQYCVFFSCLFCFLLFQNKSKLQALLNSFQSTLTPNPEKLYECYSVTKPYIISMCLNVLFKCFQVPVAVVWKSFNKGVPKERGSVLFERSSTMAGPEGMRNCQDNIAESSSFVCWLLPSRLGCSLGFP